jgi:hypothetical protein
MVTDQDIEGFLIRMAVSFDAPRPGTWIIKDNEDQVDNLVVTLNHPVVVFHVRLGDVPASCDRLALYEALLRLNMEEMVHGAYGLQGNAVVASDTLQAENLDFNEFQASVDALNVCITSHARRLRSFFVV